MLVSCGDDDESGDGSAPQGDTIPPGGPSGDGSSGDGSNSGGNVNADSGAGGVSGDGY